MCGSFGTVSTAIRPGSGARVGVTHRLVIERLDVGDCATDLAELTATVFVASVGLPLAQTRDQLGRFNAR